MIWLANIEGTFWFQRNTPGFALVYYFAWTDCKQAMNRHKKMAEVYVYHAKFHSEIW